MDGDARPDPDALLRRVNADEQRAARAKLKVFLGFAPGVGKTYRMLRVAREEVEEGTDVVVGVVETHGRKETADLVAGLEVLPRRDVAYRGRTLDEFDLDEALRRKPALLLLDELAHTNAPGSRHAKRWQDVQELLDAGIDVMTTLNVQHVESLNDVVAQITHIRVRETVPDSVLDRADDIEVVDLAPEDLLERLREGKVYLPDQAARAAQHFFQRGNLLALRELALRRAAERVDAEMLAYRSEQGVDSTWAAGERIMVCVGPAPASARLVRAARRIAAGLRAPWVATYVDAPGRAPLLSRDRERLEANLQLASSMGATVARLSGTVASEAILGYARKHNVTRIVIGKPTHSRLRDVLRGSLLDEIVRGSGGIDVNVISGDDGETREKRPPDAVELTRRAPLLPYAWTTLLVAVTTGLAALGHDLLGVPDVEMLYLLGVMVAASRFGRGPSIAAALMSVAAFDFFFVPPRFTFAVADARYGLTFAMMFGVGVLLSSLALRVRRQEQDAIQREERSAALFALSRDLASATERGEIARAAAARASDVFAAPAAVYGWTDQGVIELARTPPGEAATSRDDGVVRWVFEHRRRAGLGTDAIPGADVVCSPLGVGDRPLGVLALTPPGKVPLRAEQLDLLDAFGRVVALALDRVHLTDEARQAALRAKSEEMRSSLLSTVSHDLRTPLAAITGAATMLRDDVVTTEPVRGELLGTICDEAERLERLVRNLLDMTRLDSGAVSPNSEWLPVVEVVGAALNRMEARLQGREVEVDLPDDLPMVHLDPVLAEQLFVNLLENTAKHTPAGTSLAVIGRSVDAAVTIEVADRGPGFPAEDQEKIFERFYRPRGSRTEGVGLGLAICRAIAEAHGATLSAENRPGGGAVFRLTIPRRQEPPRTSDPA